MNIDIVTGWCACWQTCGGVAVECVRVPGEAELCVACAARGLGLPGDTAAGNVVAAMLRGEGVGK